MHSGVFGLYWFAQSHIVSMTLPVRVHSHSHECPGLGMINCKVTLCVAHY